MFIFISYIKEFLSVLSKVHYVPPSFTFSVDLYLVKNYNNWQFFLTKKFMTHGNCGNHMVVSHDNCGT